MNAVVLNVEVGLVVQQRDSAEQHWRHGERLPDRRRDQLQQQQQLRIEAS